MHCASWCAGGSRRSVHDCHRGGRSLGVALGDVDFALGALEHEGFVLRGRFTPGSRSSSGASGACWPASTVTPSTVCARRSSRHRCGLHAVPVAWQRAAPDARPRAGRTRSRAGAAGRVRGTGRCVGSRRASGPAGRIRPLWLDGLCLSGRSPGAVCRRERLERPQGRPIRTTPIALFRRERGAVWRSLTVPPDPAQLPLSHSPALRSMRSSNEARRSSATW